MAAKRPEGKYLIPGSNSNKMASALQKPKMVISGGRSKSQAEIDKIFGITAVKKTSRGPVTGTGTSSGTTTKKTPDLPKSTKMSESAKKITGTAKGSKTSTAAKANAMTKNGMKMTKRAGSK
jgi:response regulator of citrate/malate metabolism